MAGLNIGNALRGLRGIPNNALKAVSSRLGALKNRPQQQNTSYKPDKSEIKQVANAYKGNDSIKKINDLLEGKLKEYENIYRIAQELYETAKAGKNQQNDPKKFAIQQEKARKEFRNSVGQLKNLETREQFMQPIRMLHEQVGRMLSQDGGAISEQDQVKIKELMTSIESYDGSIMFYSLRQIVPLLEQEKGKMAIEWGPIEKNAGKIVRDASSLSTLIRELKEIVNGLEKKKGVRSLYMVGVFHLNQGNKSSEENNPEDAVRNFEIAANSISKALSSTEILPLSASYYLPEACYNAGESYIKIVNKIDNAESRKEPAGKALDWFNKANEEVKKSQERLLKNEGKSPALKAEVAQVVRMCKRLEPFILLGIGEAKINLGSYEEAISSLNSARSISSENDVRKRAYDLMVRAFLEKGEENSAKVTISYCEEAIKDFEQAIKVSGLLGFYDGNSPAARERLSACYSMAGLAYLNLANTINKKGTGPNKEQYRKEVLGCLMSSKAWLEKSLSLQPTGIRIGLKTYPNKEQVVIYLAEATIEEGQAYENLQEFRAAINAYEEAKKLGGNKSKISFYAGRVYYKTKNYREALKHLSEAKANELDGLERVKYELYLALANYRVEDIEEAWKLFSGLLKVLMPQTIKNEEFILEIKEESFTDLREEVFNALLGIGNWFKNKEGTRYKTLAIEVFEKIIGKKEDVVLGKIIGKREKDERGHLGLASAYYWFCKEIFKEGGYSSVTFQTVLPYAMLSIKEFEWIRLYTQSFKQAGESIKQLVAEFSDAYRIQGDCLLHSVTQKFDEASESYQKALDLIKDNAEAKAGKIIADYNRSIVFLEHNRKDAKSKFSKVFMSFSESSKAAIDELGSNYVNYQDLINVYLGSNYYTALVIFEDVLRILGIRTNQPMDSSFILHYSMEKGMSKAFRERFAQQHKFLEASIHYLELTIKYSQEYGNASWMDKSKELLKKINTLYVGSRSHDYSIRISRIKVMLGMDPDASTDTAIDVLRLNEEDIEEPVQVRNLKTEQIASMVGILTQFRRELGRGGFRAKAKDEGKVLREEAEPLLKQANILLLGLMYYSLSRRRGDAAVGIEDENEYKLLSKDLERFMITARRYKMFALSVKAGKLLEQVVYIGEALKERLAEEAMQETQMQEKATGGVRGVGLTKKQRRAMEKLSDEERRAMENLIEKGRRSLRSKDTNLKGKSRQRRGFSSDAREPERTIPRHLRMRPRNQQAAREQIEQGLDELNEDY